MKFSLFDFVHWPSLERGTPDQESQVMRAHLENLMCIMGIGPMSHEETMKSLRLFGEKVLPEFADQLT